MASTIALDRLLARLEATLASPSSDAASPRDFEQYARLQKSQFERNRVGANIEHARALLIALEKQAAGVRVQSQKQQAQEQLQRRRQAIKQLTQRLRDLNAKDQEDDNDDYGDDSDGDEEDVLNTYAPARKDINAGLDTGRQPSQQEITSSNRDGQPSHSDPDPAPIPNTTLSEATLRSRRPNPTANTTQASTTARETLFSGRTTNAQATTATAQTESKMSHNRIEQEALTNGLIGLARALKESSLNFSASLETEKDIVSRAASGLDKNAAGMAAAEKKMGLLRRMSEGQGWWGRIKLYGFIAALWLACLVVVFILPKLRF